ncbi:DUF4336 domain-containing protein [Vibrio mimicus]|uniref:DUF4336 domain-containing protein n=1 Tax=Vibrio mimicus TaxID=674 RepID=UPI002F951027
MQLIGERIWIFDGEAVPFFNMPYTTRMTIIKLNDGRLWVHSPIRLTETLKAEVDSLGEIAYLIAPNHLHHLFIKDWQDAFPQAQAFGTQEVAKKRPDLHFDGLLTSDFAVPWGDEIAYLLFTGSKVMQESVFFHPLSHTLILTDLIENFSPSAITGWRQRIARWAGVMAPNGQTPLDWRLTFYFNKAEASRHMSTILSWEPKQIVLAHGEWIKEQAVEFLRHSFRWLKLEKHTELQQNKRANNENRCSG